MNKKLLDEAIGKMVKKELLKEEDWTRGSGQTQAQKTRQWLESFLGATKVKYKIQGKTVTLWDDVYSVQLEIYGGKSKLGK